VNGIYLVVFVSEFPAEEGKMSWSLGRLVSHRPFPFHGVLGVVFVMVVGSGTAVAAAAALFVNDHRQPSHAGGRPRTNDGEQPRPDKNWPAATALVGTIVPFVPQFRRRTATTIMMTSCEGLVDNATAAVLENAKDDDNARKSTTTNTITWEKMKLPDRATDHSQAIFGTLLNDDRIERYDVYRRVSSTTTTLATTSRDETEDDDDDTDRRSNHNTAVRAMVRLGGKLNGHPGIVHGGILALLIDDILGFGFAAANVNMAVTANLNIDYRVPVPAGTTIVVDAILDEQRRVDAPRKLYWNVTVTDAADPSLVYCHATSLFIIPRQHHQQM
jgi:acyl-coenzyme A thioesterase PaaI-like protein